MLFSSCPERGWLTQICSRKLTKAVPKVGTWWRDGSPMGISSDPGGVRASAQHGNSEHLTWEPEPLSWDLDERVRNGGAVWQLKTNLDLWVGLEALQERETMGKGAEGISSVTFGYSWLTGSWTSFRPQLSLKSISVLRVFFEWVSVSRSKNIWIGQFCLPKWIMHFFRADSVSSTLHM